MGECSPYRAGTGEIKYAVRTKTSTAALQFDIGLLRLEEENLHQKAPRLPGWGLMQQANPLLIGRRSFLKKPTEKILDGCKLRRRKLCNRTTLLGTLNVQ
jgi:hypothetical protein